MRTRPSVSEFEKALKFRGLDPKPYELIQIRLKNDLLLFSRTKLMSVEKDWEEFGLGVKG